MFNLRTQLESEMTKHLAIKNLEWEHGIADCLAGRYKTFQLPNGKWAVSTPEPFSLITERFSGPASAEVAAQADYKRRIMSCFEDDNRSVFTRIDEILSERDGEFLAAIDAHNAETPHDCAALKEPDNAS